MDFAPVDESMPPNAKIRLAPVGGRSSNTSAFPFFNIEAPNFSSKLFFRKEKFHHKKIRGIKSSIKRNTEEFLFSSCEGVMVGIGWSGQWAAELIRDAGASLRVRAGMELTHLKLYPGEEIRTPRILLLFWRGDDYLCGHNLLRRFILAHHTLQKDGKPVTTPIACSGSKIYDIANKATEQNQIALVKRYIELVGAVPEYLWLDAGWFEGGWPNGVGNWFPKKDAFPNGLKAVSDAIKEMGLGLLLWFEPERVHQGTWLDREHPNWILRLPNNPLTPFDKGDNPNGLFNLGNPQARRWLTEHISGMIENEGIGVYRHDFNMEPLPFWRAADEPDRQGITEIRHIEGLYAFWDELLARHPGLIIDNCASGGRRIDLEMISRSLPLWRTDHLSSFSIEPTGQQSHTYGLHLYLPCNSVANSSPDPYVFRSSMTSGIILRWNPYEPDFPAEQAKRMVDEFKRLRPFFYGDFYPITSHSVRDDVWMSYQFHREDLGQGMILAFRRPESPYIKARLKLNGLKRETRYELNFEDTGVKQTFTGEELSSGLDVTIKDAPGSLLVTYRQCS
jgi:alpha-galactosidase